VSVNRSSSRKPAADLEQEEFDRLLSWLGRDRESAGNRYEEIRSRLIRIFICRGCAAAEEMADDTINRVARKLPQISETYIGDPALYFYGVAQMVHLEHVRRVTVTLPPPPANTAPETEVIYQCLDECMESLSTRNRELIVKYYAQGGRAKIDERKELAEKLGIGPNALWIRAHRIRESLRECVNNCLSRGAVE
jgi:DNA-directed RNA polymerase specialized sigma24 family protein